MNDSTTIRCVTILGGVALLIAAGVEGFNGEIHAIAYGMLGFGVGIPVGGWLETKPKKPS